METPHREKELKQRRFLLVLPLLTLPFLMLAFWALGGGSSAPLEKEEGGLNLNLPAADLEEDSMNKLSLYQVAEKDSMLREEQLRTDPYADLARPQKDTGARRLTQPTPIRGMDPKPSAHPEQKVEKKLTELQRIISRPQQTAPQARNTGKVKTAEPEISSDIERLEAMMHQMSEPESEDPEMEQIGNMLDKILDVQHPDRVRQRLEERFEQQRGAVFSVGQNPSRETEGKAYYPAETNRFYSLEDQAGAHSEWGVEVKPAIRAVVHETQTLVSGATLKMRLEQEVYIGGMLISKGSLVYGQAAVDGERLRVAIEGIRHEGRIFPVKLQVYSLDALPGIRIPGAISRKVTKDGADDAVQNMGITSFDPSLEMQAASAGIETAKGLFSKKLKRIRVTVKAGHPVLLVDKNQNNH